MLNSRISLPRKTKNNVDITYILIAITLSEITEQYFKRLFVGLLKLFIRSRNVSLPPRSSVKNILVIRQHDQLGDMLCAVPLLRTLRHHYPDSHITLVASPVNFSIMRHHPYVDDVINYDKTLVRKSLSEILSFHRMLRSRRYDLALVPTTVSISMTSDILAWLSRASVRIGPKSLMGKSNPTAFLYTHAIDLRWDNEPRTHQALRNLDILKPFELQCDDLSTVIGLPDDELQAAQEFLKPYRAKHKLLIGFHPGAGKPENRWPSERFASVANRLCEAYQAAAVITVGPMDGEVFKAMKANFTRPFIAIENRSIREVAAIISELDLILTNDTGILHVACGTQTHVVALFGPTDPLQWAPVGQKNRFILARDGDISSIHEDEVYDMMKLVITQLPSVNRKM